MSSTTGKRRDVFIFVSQPGRADEAQAYLGDFLRSLEVHPGYLGGSVLKECAGELLPGTLVLILEFASTEDARALWPKIETTVNPLYPDDKSDTSPDQGTAFFDGTGDAAALRFSRGGGLLARMLHIHAAEADAFAPAAS
jgi:hypothetical protein